MPVMQNFEHIVASNVVKHFDENQILYYLQHCFRSNTTDHAYHTTSISFYKKLGLRFAYINLNVKESDRTVHVTEQK